MKKKKIYLEYNEMMNEPSWKVTKVQNLMEPTPGEHLKKGKVEGLIRGRDVDVVITPKK